MSTVHEPAGVTKSEDLGPIGFRYVEFRRPDGRVDFRQVPLTLEDALHPREGDVILESDIHDKIRRYLADICEARLAYDPGVVVLSDVQINWHHPDFGDHAPDVSVIYGVPNPKPEYTSFDVVAEGARPRVIFEVVSPNTRVNDVETKLEHYHTLKIPYYIIVDRTKVGGPWVVRAFQYTPAKYKELTANEDGLIWLEPLKMWIGVRDNVVLLFDGETREPIGNYTQLSELIAEKTLLVDEVSARTDYEQQRAEREKVRAEKEKARAEKEKARAEQEKNRAEQEKIRAENAEARLREIEAELARLRDASGS